MEISWLFNIGTHNLSIAPVTFNEVTYLARIVGSSFNGIQMSYSQGNYLFSPVETTFQIDNSSETYTKADFENKECLCSLVINGVVTRKWKLKVQTVTVAYNIFYIKCVDILQDVLYGEFPNSLNPDEIFPTAYNVPEDDEYGDYRTPIFFSEAYIPCKWIYISGEDKGYYLLEQGTVAPQVLKVKSPNDELIYENTEYTFNVYTKTSSAGDSYQVVDLLVREDPDNPGTYLSGKWSTDTKPLINVQKASGSITDPAEIIKAVLIMFGVDSGDIDTASFAAATSAYATQGIVWQTAFYKKQSKEQILLNLLKQCDSYFYIDDKIKLVPFSKTTVETIDKTKVRKKSLSVSNRAVVRNDSGHVKWISAGKPQDILQEKAVVSIVSGGTTSDPDNETLELNFINDSEIAQKLGILYFEKKLAKKEQVSFQTSGAVLSTVASITPGQTVLLNDPIFGGQKTMLLSNVNIKKDVSVELTGNIYDNIKEFYDITASSITVPDDSISPNMGAVYNLGSLRLSATSQIFSFSESGVPDPASQEITFTAYSKNLNADTYNFTTTPDIKSQNTAANTFTINETEFGSNSQVQVSVTAKGQQDYITIVRVTDGANGYAVFQTNPSTTYIADHEGTVSDDFSIGNNQLEVYYGATQLTCDSLATSDPTVEQTYRVADITISPAAGIAYSTGIVSDQFEFQPSGMSENSCKVTFTIKALINGTITTFSRSCFYVKAIAGAPGETGGHGYNQANISLFQRSASLPTITDITDPVTYTFSTGTIAESIGAWSRTIPSGENPLYVVMATAISVDDTDSIAQTEWGTPVIFAENGTDGDSGSSGVNSAVVFLYKRSSGTPAKPTTTATYIFSTGVLSGHNNGWTQNVPATDGNPLWLIQANALATAPQDFDTILSSEWGSQVKIMEDGTDGLPGSNGINARSVSLSAGTMAFTYTAAGASPSPSNTTVTATALNTEGTVYYKFLVNGSFAQHTTSNTYTYTPESLHSSMPETVTVEIREGSTLNPVLASDSISMIGVKPGADGTNGTDGADAITILLTNEAHTLPKTNAGVITYTGSGTDIKVWRGATQVAYGTGNSQFSVTASGSGISYGSASTVSTYTRRYADASNMTAAIASITFTITVKDSDGVATVFTKVQSFSQSIEGADGTNGIDGTDAQTIRIAATSHIFRVTEAGVNSPDYIDIFYSLQNITGTINWTTTPTVTLTDIAGGKRLTYANMGANNTVKVVADIGGLSDSLTLAKLFDGSTGQDGFAVFLTNESHTYPASSDGTISGGFTPGYCQVRVYNGGTLLTCDSTSTTATTTDGRYRVTSITVTSGTMTTSSALVSSQYEIRPSAMSTDYAVVTLEIQARWNGQSTTFTRQITYSKSKAGIDGSQGDPGVDQTNWNITCVFSSTDYNTVAWTTGQLFTAGTTYTISSAGNTGNMTGLTYIYFDPGVSTTALQTTTTAGNAVGTGKILVCAAKNNTDTSSDAPFQVFGGSGGMMITSDNIAAKTITANEVAANTITAAEIDVADLFAQTITVGTGGHLKSNNYVLNTSGWKVTDTSAEFNTVTVRGTLASSSFSTAEIASTGARFVVDKAINSSRYYNGSNELVYSAGADTSIGSWLDTLGYARGDIESCMGFVGVGYGTNKPGLVGCVGKLPAIWTTQTIAAAVVGHTDGYAEVAAFSAQVYGTNASAVAQSGGYGLHVPITYSNVCPIFFDKGGATIPSLYIWPNRTDGGMQFSYTKTGDRHNVLTVNPSKEINETGLVIDAASVTFDTQALDTYEEGTYTPTLTCGSGSVTLASGNDTLAYTIIGRQVTVTGKLQLSAISSPSGTLTMSLPVVAAIANLTDTSEEFVSYVSQTFSQDVMIIFGSSGSNVSFYYQTVSTGAGLSSSVAGSLATGSGFAFNFSYFTV